MRLGLLADIHEEVDLLKRAIEALQSAGVSQFVVLGDIFETGRAIDATVEVLAALTSVGVWGNHDFGLCRDVGEPTRKRYSPSVLTYFGSLHPWIELHGCRFQHIEPFLDSEHLEDLWAYGGDGNVDAVGSFDACASPRMFMGHIHRWELIAHTGPTGWSGREPIHLKPQLRYLVVVNAIQQGWCAWYDTKTDLLCPVRVNG